MTASDKRAANLIGRSHQNHRWSIATALIVLTVGVYILVIGAGFLHWDDMEMVVTNADLRPDHWPAVLSCWHRPHLKLFIPLTYSLYFCLSSISLSTAGILRAEWFHTANLMLHLGSGLVAWRILTRLSGSEMAAGIGAAIFLLHPLQVEPVSWVSSLNTVLAGFGAIVALWLFIYSSDTTDRRAKRLYYAAACAVSVLALLAKPSVCGLPIIVLCVDRLLLKKPWKPALVSFAFLCVLSAPIIWIGRFSQPSVPSQYIGLPRRLAVALDAVGFYATKLICPMNLCIDYGRTPASVTFGKPLFLTAIVAFIVLTALTWNGRRRPWLTAGVVIFLAGLLPVLGLVPFDFQLYSTVADRYAYLSLLGPALVVTFALRQWVTRRIVLAACGCLILVLGVMSHWQSYSWLSDDSLFDQALAINPRSIAAHATLGFLAAQTADQNAADPVKQAHWLSVAFQDYSAVLSIRPDHALTQFNLANLLMKHGHADLAITHFAAVTRPFDAETQLENNWGVACLQLKHPDEAAAHFRNAITVSPGFADAYANAGLAYAQIGRFQTAFDMFSKALQLDPQQAQARKGVEALRSRPH